MSDPEANILKTFGTRVRELRKAAGYSQETFAQHCGLDRTYLSSLERGHRNVSLRNIERIALALDIQISILMRDL
ncbi:MAG: helix-turn-helix transcriptional regulator [Gammaproteobacteria bacterium]|nr:helix-turn-helix transcriptional regulator [Gammaproteobacteria bacterium]